MKRSGSTLQYNIAASVLRVSGRGEVAGWVSRDALDSSQPPVSEWLSSDRLYLIKSHKLMSEAPALLNSGRLLLLYSYRDVRDVAASAIRTFENVSGLQDAIEIIDEALEVERQIQGQPGVLSQSYEVLCQQTAEAVREIATLLGARLSPSQVSQICTENGIEQVEKQVSRKKTIRRIREMVRPIVTRLGLLRPARFLYRRWFAPEIRKTKESLVRDNHVTSNRGRSGTWHEILSSSDAAELTARYETWLRNHGYSV